MMIVNLRHMAFWLSCLLLLAATPAMPQRNASMERPLLADTLEIRFPLDSFAVNLGFDGNAARWQTFERNFNRLFAGKEPAGIVLDIYAGASPEGSAAHNFTLAQRRGESIRRFLEQRLKGRVGDITLHNEGPRWQRLYDEIAAGNEYWRDEALAIISQPAKTAANGRDERENKLRKLHDGWVWTKLQRLYMPQLRSGGSAVVSWQPERIAAERDTIYIKDTIVIVDKVPVYPKDLVYASKEGDLYNTTDSTRVYKPVVRKPVWLLRTNLPLLAVGTPNLQAEWSLDSRDRWSVNLEAAFSWWTFAYNGYANQLIYGSAELRYWLGRRWRHHTLDGWHIGLGVGGGYGDVEWRSRGYQAELYSGFLNIGWQKRFGRNRQWAFDLGIGLGYAHIPYRRYRGSRIFPEGHEEVHDDHLMWQETNRLNWIGTPHVNISIGYVFPQRDAEWKRDKAVKRQAERNEYLHFRDSMRVRERYERDSLHTAQRQRRMEIVAMPKSDERKAAFEAYYAEKRQLKAENRELRKQAKLEDNRQKQLERQEKKLLREQAKQEKALRKAQLREMKAWKRTEEGRIVLRQMKVEDQVARRQMKEEAKQAKAQAKQERKASRIRKRIEAQQRRNQERMRRELEQTKNKYRINGEWKMENGE